MLKLCSLIKPKQYKFICIYFAIIVLGFLNSRLYAQENSSNKKKEIIVIHDPKISRSEKEALIILPGRGDSKKVRKNQKKFFENVGYDLFIPDYIDKDSYEGTSFIKG